MAAFPLVVPLVLAMAMGPLMPWKRAQLWPVIQRLWAAALIALSAFFVALLLSGEHVLPAVGFGFASDGLAKGDFGIAFERSNEAS